MSISFIRQNNELILIYVPERIEKQEILDLLEKNEKWRINHVFFVSKKHLRTLDIDDNELCFCIGEVQEEYTCIDREVFNLTHHFYFYNKITLNKRHFVAYRDISILLKIDKIINQNVYIGGNHSEACIPIEVFELLIKNFPKTTELTYYTQARIATIVKEFFPKAESYEIEFKKFIESREKKLATVLENTNQTFFQKNISTELFQFNSIKKELIELLEREQSVSEHIWQEQIHGLLRLLYPKYIAGIREVVIKGGDRHDKRPDFFLIDANGYIDILEIKKPSVQLLTKQSSYRNNYVPVRDLAGAIQQIEKYIYYLNSCGTDGEKRLKQQLIKKLPDSITPKIVNPQGILLLGRSNNFNVQQKNDFELIKRQYKHITEIMTYDELLQCIDNIIAALSKEIN